MATHFLITVTVDLVLTAVSDVIITGYLVFYIKRMQKTSEFERTNSIIDTILRNTIETNGLTAVASRFVRNLETKQ
jgi:Na+-transporting NADH:ubiquinone oxidoreductase subunit NqrC